MVSCSKEDSVEDRGMHVDRIATDTSELSFLHSVNQHSCYDVARS